TVKFGGGSLTVWGCIGWNRYVAILKQELLQSMEKLKSGISECDIIFQQDNGPGHTSRRA
ncbi:hypothetical protein PAXRUDRAFT_168596, partial [Paxillus rubicundulus Ve08.2h10]